MFETTVTFEVTNGLVRDEHALLAIGLAAQAEAELDRRSEDIARRHVEMKSITTERGLEARWAVRPEEPALLSCGSTGSFRRPLRRGSDERDDDRRCSLPPLPQTARVIAQ